MASSVRLAIPRRAAVFVASLLVLVATTLAATTLVGAAPQRANGGNGTIYIAGYDDAIHILDEATMEEVGKIVTTAGSPQDLLLSHDRRRFYTLSIDFERIEVFDIETRQSLGVHGFSADGARVRIWGIAPHPDDRMLMLLTSTDTKKVDRWEISEPIIRQYDMEAREFVRDFPWPDGQVLERANFMFSPDGKLLYFFARDVLVYDFESFEEVDRWEISTPFETGMGRLRLSFNPSLYEEEGYFTGLFNTTDPVNNRRMMGMARINLPEKSLEFYTLGPSTGMRSFALAPDRTKAYGLRSQIGNYEIWTFDLENRRVADRRTFPGRPRMGLTVSSNGELLYIHTAGNTIDIYAADSLDFVRTVELDADMLAFVVLPAGAARTP